MSFVSLAKIEINDNISIFLGLQKIYGIGRCNSQFLCKIMGLNPNLKIFELDTVEISDLDYFISYYFLTGLDLRRKYFFEVKSHIDLKTYKGLKHRQKNNT